MDEDPKRICTETGVSTEVCLCFWYNNLDVGEAFVPLRNNPTSRSPIIDFQ